MQFVNRIFHFLVVCAIATPAQAFDTWIFRKSSEPGHKPWGYTNTEAPHPVRYGKYSDRFEVRAGDCGWNNNFTWNDCENERERHELTSHGTSTRTGTIGDLFWYRFSLYIPKENKRLSGIDINFVQIYAQTGRKRCGPVLQITQVPSGEIYVKGIPVPVEFDTSLVDNGRQSKGKWYDIVINALWTTEQFGYVQIFVNGKRKITAFGPTLVHGCTEYVYFKYGIYRHYIPKGAKLPTTVAYFDGLRRGRTEDGMFDVLDE